MASPTSKRSWGPTLTLVGLAFMAALLLAARGITKKPMGDDYINDVKMSNTGMMRFHNTQGGPANTGPTTKRVHFVDIINLASGEATLTLYSPAAPPSGASTGDTVRIFVPVDAARSIDGIPVDSINVVSAGTINAANPIIFTGRTQR